MDAISQIDVNEAKKLLDDGNAVFVDIRDPGSYAGGHIPGAMHLTEDVLRDFVSNTDKGAKVVAYCYHGNSSQGAAGWLMEQGFTDVHSMAGGFEMWRTMFADDVEA